MWCRISEVVDSYDLLPSEFKRRYKYKKCKSPCTDQCLKNYLCYTLTKNCNPGKGKVHAPTLAAIREHFGAIVDFARVTPAQSPPPLPACDESESESDDLGAIARRTRSRTK